jgi:hypothetical protein
MQGRRIIPALLLLEKTMTNWNPFEIDCGCEPSALRAAILPDFEDEMEEDLKHPDVQRALSLTPRDEERAMDEQAKDWEMLRQRELKDSPLKSSSNDQGTMPDPNTASGD